jgi:carbamoyltransferase
MARFVLGFSGMSAGQFIGLGHHPAAVLLRDGRLVGAAGEERFSRVKNANGEFPHRAISWLLGTAGIELSDLSAIAWSNDPVGAQTRWAAKNPHRGVRRAITTLVREAESRNSPTLRGIAGLIDTRFRPHEFVRLQRAGFVRHFGGRQDGLPLVCVDHHLCHAASAYYASGMREATVITWDGSGDGLTATVRHGRNGQLDLVTEYSDFSIGELYWCIHSYLNLSDEGSLMGLAAYGKPNGILDVYVRPAQLWMDSPALLGYGSPDAAHLSYDPTTMASLAPPRRADDNLLQAHRDLAAELQAKVEELCFEVVERAVAQTGCKNLAVAGGVGLNAVVNGKLGRRRDLCESLFVQPNAGDEGGALGAAFVVARGMGDDPSYEMNDAYLGPEESNDDIRRTLDNVGVAYTVLPDEELFPAVARELSEGRLIGWAQGKLEWGPRALGNRSILADPRDPKAGARVNTAVKYRDPWRPFAPSMLAEAADDFLVDSFFSPFMITTFEVQPDKRTLIPSVVHADGTTRPQMVTADTNPRFYRLIKEFSGLTGVPMVLNTSFNLKGEPIVTSTLDALRTFFASGLDVLVFGNHIVRK